MVRVAAAEVKAALAHVEEVLGGDGLREGGEITRLEAALRLARGRLAALDDRAGAVTRAQLQAKGQARGQAAADVAEMIDELRAVRVEVDRVRSRAVELRLGGSCSHGADQGKDCALCAQQFGRRKGPYVNMPDGAEVCDHLVNVAKRSGASVSSLMCRLDIVSAKLKDLDDGCRAIDRAAKTAGAKVDLCARLLGPAAPQRATPQARHAELTEQSAGAAGAGARARDAADGGVGGPRSPRQRQEPPETIQYRMAHVRVGPALNFYAFLFRLPETGSKKDNSRAMAQAKDYLFGKAPGGKHRLTPPLCVANVSDISSILRRWAAVCLSGPKAQPDDIVSCKVRQLHHTRYADPDDAGRLIEAEDDIFDLDLTQEGALAFRCKLVAKPGPKATRAAALRNLCKQHARWGVRERHDAPPRAAIEPNEALLAALKAADASPSSSGLSLVALDVSDEDLVALGVVLSAFPNCVALDLSYNRVADVSPLRALWARGQPGLTELVLSNQRTALERRQLGDLLRAVATSAAAHTLQRLELARSGLITHGCVCSAGVGARQSPDELCLREHKAMRDCAAELGALCAACSSLHRLVLDGAMLAVGQGQGQGQASGRWGCGMEQQDAHVSEGLRELADGLRVSAVRELLIRDCSFAKLEGAEAVFATAASSVERLGLDGTHVIPSAEDPVALAGAPAAVPEEPVSKTRDLTLRGTNAVLDPTGVLGWPRFRALERLCLARCGLESEGTRRLFQALGPHPGLIALDLSDNPRALSDSSPADARALLESLLHALAENSVLQELRAHNVGIRHWDRFLRALRASLARQPPFAAATARPSVLARLELGVGPEAPRKLDEADVGDVVRVMEAGALSRLRVWNPHRICALPVELEPRDGAPPAFEAFCSRPETAEKDISLYAIGTTAALDLAVRR